ncbi:MAG: hypothetical protein U9P63_01535, partial [Patescibacteria group bacterium]|nr:hypothetical protein [Patescibacteria group bacterium]
QNINRQRIGENEKVEWILEPGAEHCDDCLMMSGQIGTKEELKEFGVGLPGQGLTECNVGCKCMLSRVK